MKTSSVVKKRLTGTLLIVPLVIFLVTSIASASQWANIYGGADEDYAFSIQQTSDSGYITAGGKFSFGTSGDAWILKLGAEGNVLWQKTYGGNDMDYAFSIQETPDSGYIVAGTTYSFDPYGDAWVLKLDANGNIQWHNYYGIDQREELGQFILQTSDGGYFVAGNAYISSMGTADNYTWVLKLDTGGNIQWQKAYGSGSRSNRTNSIQQTSDDGYILAGNIGPFSGSGTADSWVLKLDTGGNIQWQKAYGNANNDERAYSIRQTSDTGYIVAGEIYSTSTSHGDAWVFKLDSAGVIQWQKIYDISDWEALYSIQQTPEGGYITTGSSGGASGWLLKLDSYGSVQMERTYSGLQDANSLQQTLDGGYIVTGFTRSYGAGDADALILKLDSSGNIPNCQIIGTSNTTVINTSMNVTTPSVEETVTNVPTQASTATVTDTNATVTEICYYVPSSQWTIERIDSPKKFHDFYQRAIAIDSYNHPHIVYGGDHLYHAYFDGVQWQYEVVDSAWGVGDYPSVAIDSNDNLHISYFDETNYNLKYATNASGSWVITTVDNSGNVGYQSSIAIDSNNKVHISYYVGWPNYDLRYATNASGSWVIATVDSTGDVGGANSIAIDSNNKVHISYGDGTNRDLKYATNASGSWVTAAVDSSGDVGYDTAIAADSNNKVHISYRDISNRDLKYATNASGSWIATAVDSSGYVGADTSIAVDSNNRVHISYFDESNGNLKYATNASGSWVTSTIDSSGYVGEDTSIAIDSNGKIHISYSDNGDLKYITNASGSWVASIIDIRGNVGLYTSIAVDSSNKPHISYLDAGNAKLKYATNASGSCSWVTTTVDSKSFVVRETSIAVDSNDNVHISYYDITSDDLKYATNASGLWVTTTVDSTGNVGFNASIAVDSNNKIHISYFDATNLDLKYATNASGTWVTTTVDSAGWVGWSTSIAVDSNNRAHISYYDHDNGCVKYATNASGLWVATTVDNIGTVDVTFTSIAIDSSNKVHISYYKEWPDFDLKYATNASGSWVTSTVDSTGDVGGANSIAIDSNNGVHISYYDGTWTNENLKYATNASGSWVTSTVDSVGDVGSHTSIAVDSDNKVHISYYDLTNEDLKYATNASASLLSTIGYSPTSFTFTATQGGSNPSNQSLSIGNCGGGTLNWSVSDNATWLSLNPTSGTNSGTVTVSVNIAGLTAGTYNALIIITATGATNSPVSIPVTLTINPPLPIIGYSPTSYSFTATQGGSNPTDQTLNITNTGGGTLSWSVSDNATWLSLSPTSGTNSGTVTVSVNIAGLTAGTYNATITITAAGATNSPVSIPVTLIVNAPPIMTTLLAPNGGEEIPSGSTYSIQWSAPPTAVKFRLRYSINGGSTWKLIAKNITGTSYNWIVPVQNNNKTNCLVDVTGYNASGGNVGRDTSDGPFTIEVVKITSPDGGEILKSGNTWAITWRTNATIRPVAQARLSYSRNGGTSWTAIKTLTGNPGSYNWIVPNVTSSTCKVKVVLKDSSNVTVGSDISDGFFTIQP